MKTRKCGRLRIVDDPVETTIVVPELRNWLLVIFCFPWIVCWLASMVVLPFVFLQPGVFSPSTVIWMAAWTFGGLYVTRLFVWNLAGKKTAFIKHGQMVIRRRGDFFYRKKTYDLKQMKNLRIVNYDVETNGYYTRMNYLFTKRTKSVEFDYGGKRVRALDELKIDEARCLYDTFKNKDIEARQDTWL